MVNIDWFNKSREPSESEPEWFDQSMTSCEMAP